MRKSLPGGPSDTGRLIPLGRPVVPEEYSITSPSHSSSSGPGGVASSAAS